MSGKYVVFKAEDYHKLMEELGGVAFAKLAKIEIPDAEVIRHQDLTAAPCLYAYAAIIQSFAELRNDPEEKQRLLCISDWAHDAAYKSEKLGYRRKLPD